MNYSTGRHKDFYWIETHLISISDIIAKLPELLIGKFLIICCFDSGVLVPDEKKKNRGWKLIDQLTYTEIITEDTLKQNINDNYDQWILINKRILIDKIHDFVTYDYFSLIDWNIEVLNLDSKEDIDFINNNSNQRNKLKDLFWHEIEKINPLTFISDGSKFIYISKFENEIDLIKNTVANTRL